MPDDPLIALALRLTDGESIDWKAESEFRSVDVSLLRILEQIEAVARAPECVETPIQGNDVVARSKVSGPLWGHLEVIEHIGSGSYGDVYRARDTRLGRDVALKLLRTRDGGSSDSTSLIREGHLLSRVRHPNIVTVYGADCIDGRTGVWMELICGETLEQEAQRRQTFPPDEVAQIGAVLCDALDVVHSAGLLHRDVKAQNVMRERAGRLVLMDFGSGHDAGRFAARTVEGTPLYAAPEVLKGAEASVQSDIYSLGVLLWYLLTGNYPVNGRSVDEIRRAHARRQIGKLQGRGAAVATLAVGCLAVDPRKRPPSASELGRCLRTCIQPSAVPPKSIRNWTALGVFAAAVLLLATVPLQMSSNAGSRALGAALEPIWSFDSGAIPSGAPSEDGHYFACGGPRIPVGICDVTTGTVQRVPITDHWNVVFNVQPLISPDGQRVAYHGLDLEEVRIFDLSTSVSKSLRVDPSLFVKIISWSASGDSLLAVLRPSGGRPGASVALLDSNTGIQTDLRQFDETPDDVALSHDRRHLAFTQGGDLNVTNLATGETLHIGGRQNVRGSLLWTQNDDGLLFTSGPNLAELHLIRVTDGHPIGEAEALRAYGAPPFALLGISAAGDLYYNTDRGVLVTMPSASGHVLTTMSVTYPQLARLYLAPFDMTTQQIGTLSSVAMVASRLGADWSPDSQSIAYARSDGTKISIVIRDMETALERQVELPGDSVPAPPRQTHRRDTFPWVGVIRWSSRGKILLHASSSNYLIDAHDSSVTRVDLPPVISSLDSTSVRRDLFRELYTPTAVEWAPDGSKVFYAGNGFVRGVDVDAGTLTESHPMPEIAFRSWVQLSPGQRLVAYTKPSVGRFEAGQVDVAALEDNVPVPLLVSDRACRPVGWWNGEVFVACLQDSKAPNLSALYLINVATGTKKAIRVDVQRIDHIRVRPDGRAVAIMAGQTTFGTFVLRVPK